MVSIDTGEDAAGLTIGELESRTGVAAATLRSWEQRLGFPTPVRSPGGQRRYRSGDADLVTRVVAERDRGLSLAAAVAAVRREQEVGAGSLFAQLRAAHPELDVVTLGFKTMQALTWSIEDEGLAHASRPLLIGCFQTLASFRNAGGRWRELSRLSTQAVALAGFEETDLSGTPLKVALPPDSPMLNEWSLICYDPQVSVALVAWERPRQHDRDPRRFEGVLSFDPVVVRDAAARCLVTARDYGLDDSVGVGDELVGGVSEDPRRSSSLLRRFAAYVDR